MQKPHQLTIYKFGGASVKDAAAIRNLRHIVATTGAGLELLIVVSAMGKTTNALEEIFQLAYNGQEYEAAFAQVADFHRVVAAELFPDAAAAPSHPVHALLEQLHDRLATLTPGDYDKQYDQIVSYGELLATRIVAEALQAQWLDCRPLLRTDHTWREGRLDWPTTERTLRTTVPPLLQQGPVVTQGFLGAQLADKPLPWAGKAQTTRPPFWPTAWMRQQ
ncbi:amino acid kinase family protein [Hymenobacter taeanensis]|uniref:amino acid kinase family protein n=1 Tax=Hymenobacter taeanensis TaxID=2735321 RepID=UPI0020A3743E|nr:hypothetical protein [Hymenobacter taeanensis]